MIKSRVTRRFVTLPSNRNATDLITIAWELRTVHPTRPESPRRCVNNHDMSAPKWRATVSVPVSLGERQQWRLLRGVKRLDPPVPKAYMEPLGALGVKGTHSSYQSGSV